MNTADSAAAIRCSRNTLQTWAGYAARQQADTKRPVDGPAQEPAASSATTQRMCAKFSTVTSSASTASAGSA